ncbi:MAG: hypothetical protein LBD60_02790 [Puniceicoccales bacterium]|jgi:hypothetical protein|nr:hypothetical protein [Puniceicoccales bacterium]
MVKKKVIEMVICSVLLFGNCIASEAVEKNRKVEGSQLSVSQILKEVEGLENDLSTIQNEKDPTLEDLKRGLALTQEILGKLPRNRGGISPDEWQDVRDKRYELLQVQGSIRQQITTQEMSGRMAQIERRIGGALSQKGGESAREENVFNSVEDVINYMESGEVNEQQLKKRLEKTFEYYQKGQDVEDVPPQIPEREWCQAKIIEIAFVVQKCIEESSNQELRKLVRFCWTKIVTICGEDDFKTGKLLLMSQCKAWDESRGVCELQDNFHNETARDAIEILCSASQQQGAQSEAIKFVKLIKSKAEFSTLFPISGRQR